jgi:hypothetical protein
MSKLLIEMEWQTTYKKGGYLQGPRNRLYASARIPHFYAGRFIISKDQLQDIIKNVFYDVSGNFNIIEKDNILYLTIAAEGPENKTVNFNEYYKMLKRFLKPIIILKKIKRKY